MHTHDYVSALSIDSGRALMRSFTTQYVHDAALATH